MGTTTCAIALQQDNSGRLLSVEVDPRAWTIHEVNKERNGCIAHSLFGAIGSQDVEVVSSQNSNYGSLLLSGYQTFTREERLVTGGSRRGSGRGSGSGRGRGRGSGRRVKVGHFSWGQLEQVIYEYIHTSVHI